MCDFVIYGDVMGISVYNKPELPRLNEKVREMLSTLLPAVPIEDTIVSAEVIMDPGGPRGRSCTLVTYVCTESDGMRSLERDISEDPALYAEFRKYALKCLEERLLPK